MSNYRTGFDQAQRNYDAQLPPDDEPDAPTLPPLGTCPQCRAQLEWDGVDDTKARCVTPGCKYDNGASEELNRRMWQEGQA